MSTRCETCDTLEPPEALVPLQGLDEGHRGQGHGIHLCQRCLQERQARAWPTGTEEGRRLLDALTGHRLPAQARYMYMLGGQQQIHLVRMRHDWFDRHAAPVGG